MKEIMDKLNSVVADLERKIEATDKARVKAENLEKVLKEKVAAVDERVSGLDEREANLAHIESIDKAQKDAKADLAKARESRKELDKIKEDTDDKVKKLLEDRKQFEIDKRDKSILEKKQVDALKKERAKLGDEIKEFTIKKKVDKEMNK